MQSAVKMSRSAKIMGHLLVWLLASAMGGLIFGMLRFLALPQDEPSDALPYIVSAGGAYGLYVGRAARRYQAPAREAASMGFYMGAGVLIIASPLCFLAGCRWGISELVIMLAVAFGGALALSSWLGYTIWSTCVDAVFPWATLPPKPPAPNEASDEAPAPDEPER